jgi:hypothetical protein
MTMRIGRDALELATEAKPQAEAVDDVLDHGRDVTGSLAEARPVSRRHTACRAGSARGRRAALSPRRGQAGSQSPTSRSGADDQHVVPVARF